jgi:NADPH:quinone reductase-like Zn-dependent oxidoreductase
MKAMTLEKFGPADFLALNDIAKPDIGEDEVLVRVQAAGVGPDVWHFMTGLPYLARLMGAGVRRPKSRVLGSDVAGTVEAVGTKVTQFRLGDDVYGVCKGALAEFARARADKIAPKPTNLTFEQAAAVPVSGCAALHGLRDCFSRHRTRNTIGVERPSSLPICGGVFDATVRNQPQNRHHDEQHLRNVRVNPCGANCDCVNRYR